MLKLRQSDAIVAALVLVAVGFGGGYITGTFHGKEIHAVEESKLARAILDDGARDDLPGDLREYLKGRLYWNGAIHLGKGYADGLVKDYGPIDDKELGDLIPWKGTPADSRTFRDRALAKAGLQHGD